MDTTLESEGDVDRRVEASGPGPEGRASPSRQRPPLFVPASLPASEALALLVGSMDVIALVTHHGREVGVVTAEDLTAAHGTTDELTVGDVMGREIVHIDPRADLNQSLRIYTDAGWSSAIRRHPGRPTGGAS